MLIIALVLAAIGLAALVFAVVTSNALVAWVCIGASALGVVLLIVDALRERRRHSAAPVESAGVAEIATETESADAEPAGQAPGEATASDNSDAVDNSDELDRDKADGDRPDESDADASGENTADQPGESVGTDDTVSDEDTD